MRDQDKIVTDARQVGKTTMLKYLAEGQNRTYIFEQIKIMCGEEVILIDEKNCFILCNFAYVR